jgi:peptidoglycan/LPS O-acetylase OafA/YrhL
MGVLRFLLAYSVVFMHYGRPPGLHLLFGSSVVQGFFIISGFYMALVLSEKYNTKASIWDFYVARALRIFPAYFVVFLLALVSFFIMGRNNWVESGQSVVDLLSATALQQFLIVFPNIFILGQDILCYIYFSGRDVFFTNIPTEPVKYSNQYILIPQAWTIALELYFYALAPFLNRWKTWALASIVMASLLLRLTFSYFEANAYLWLYIFFPSNAAFFILGMISYRLYRWGRHYWDNSLINIPSVAILATMPLTYAWWAPISGAISARFLPDGHLFLYVAPLLLPGAFAASRNWAWDRKIGELSYSIYIVHFLIFQWTFHLTETTYKFGYFTSTQSILIYNAMTLVAAIAIYRFIDNPIDRWRHSLWKARSKSAEVNRLGDARPH